MQISIESKRLDLKVNWKLSRNETLFKENFFIKITDGSFYGLGEIAPNIRYNETKEKILEDFEHFQKLNPNFDNILELLKIKDFSHSFKFGVESAFIHLKSKKGKKSVSVFLGLTAPKPIETSYSIPIMDESLLDDYIKNIERFKYIKIKINKDNALSFVKQIASKTAAPLRVDGNEAWDSLDEYLEFEEKIKDLNIQFIEQPFASTMVDEYISLKKISRFEIMADESIESNVDMELIAKQFHSVNIKLMKASGYINAIRLLNEAKACGLKTMIGCMIETSLGISSAIHLSSLCDYFDLDGSLLLKNDPYDFISESRGVLSLNS